MMYNITTSIKNALQYQAASFNNASITLHQPNKIYFWEMVKCRRWDLDEGQVSLEHMSVGIILNLLLTAQHPKRLCVHHDVNCSAHYDPSACHHGMTLMKLSPDYSFL